MIKLVTQNYQQLTALTVIISLVALGMTCIFGIIPAALPAFTFRSILSAAVRYKFSYRRTTNLLITYPFGDGHQINSILSFRTKGGI